MMTLTPQVAGTVVTVAAGETDTVRQGQTLVRLDDADAVHHEQFGHALAAVFLPVPHIRRGKRRRYALADSSVLYRCLRRV